MTNFNILLDEALKKFPKAKAIAVGNFASGYDKLTMEALLNLEMDAKMYKWNPDTVKAIKYILNKRK